MRVGTDIIELSRVSVDEKFLDKIANKNELDYVKLYKCENGLRQRVAGLWCVKEAVMKALGLGMESGVTMKDIELCHETSGRPFVKLSKIALKKFKELNLQEIEVSISHSETIAMAICVVR